MQGRLCRLEPLIAATHAAALHEAYSRHPGEANWTYLPYGPFSSAAEYGAWVKSIETCDDPIPFVILNALGNEPVGVASYLRINPPEGSIEVGHLSYSPALQRTTAATEAMYLMMHRAFDEFGYRRYEWKCDSRNADSRRAAARLGFRYEGTFRQAMVMKGRNRGSRSSTKSGRGCAPRSSSGSIHPTSTKQGANVSDWRRSCLAEVNDLLRGAHRFLTLFFGSPMHRSLAPSRRSVHQGASESSEVANENRRSP